MDHDKLNERVQMLEQTQNASIQNNIWHFNQHRRISQFWV